MADQRRDRAHGDARRVHGHQEDGDAALARAGARQQETGLRHAGIGGPYLAAVDDVLAAARHRARGQRGEVGTGRGFGESLAPHRAARGHVGQVAGLLLRRSEFHQRGADEVGVHVLRPARLARGEQFLADDEVLPCRRIASAMRGRPMRHQQALGRELGAERQRKRRLRRRARAMAADVFPVGRQFARQQRAHALAQGPLFGCPFEIHALFTLWR